MYLSILVPTTYYTYTRVNTFKFLNIRCLLLRFKRNITDLDKHIAAGDKRVGAFTDLVWGTTTVEPEAKALLDTLRSKDVPAALPAQNLHEYDVEFAPGVGIDPNNSVHAAYISKLVEDFHTAMTTSISANVSKLDQRGSLEEEILQHLIKARDLAANFAGRRAVLDTVREYLRSPDACSPLVIHGDSGCGKSALAAAIANMAREEMQAKKLSGSVGTNGALVIRFVGLSADSSDLKG